MKKKSNYFALPNRNSSWNFKFSVSIFTILFLWVVFLGCKDKIDLTASPIVDPKLAEIQKSLDDPRPVVGNIRYFITDPNLEIGIIERIPSLKVDMLVYGNKDTNGFLKDVTKTILYNPNTKGWVKATFDKGYPTQFETSKGYVIDLGNYNRSNSSVEVTVKNKSDNKVVFPQKTVTLNAEFFQNIDAYKSYSGGRQAAIQNICNKNTAKAVAVAGVAVNTFACVMGTIAVVTAVSATGVGLVLLPAGISAIISCYGAGTGIYEAITEVNITEKYLGPYGDCAYKGAGIGYGVAFDCVRSIKFNVEAILNCSATLIGGEADAYGCGCKDDPKNPAHGTGDPHLMTHDAVSYDFHGHGEFIAVKSTLDNLEIQVRQEDYNKSGRVTVNTGISVQTGTDVVCTTIKPNRLYINKQVQDLTNLTTLSLKDGASITKTKERNVDVLNITLKNGDLLKVVFQNAEYLDYYLYLADNRKGKVFGLLGNYDGDKTNDIVVRNGENILQNGSLSFDKLYPTYADSWRITQANSLFFYESGKTTDSYTQKDFPRTLTTLTTDQKVKAESVCRAAGVSSEPFLSNCIFDVAITNNNDLAKSAFWGQQIDDRNSIPIPIIQESVNVKRITTFGVSSYILKSDGTLWATGWNDQGRFGIGTATFNNKNLFAKIMEDVKDIASGNTGNHMLFLKNDNSVWAAGYNAFGQIGNGATNGANVATAVKIMSDAKAIAIGGNTSFIIKSDNSLWAFGNGVSLINGSTNNA